MPGFKVGVVELIDGEWWVWVETTADRAASAKFSTWASHQVVLCWSKRI